MRFFTHETQVYNTLKKALVEGNQSVVDTIRESIVAGLGLNKGKKADKAKAAEFIFSTIGKENAEAHKEGGRQGGDTYGDALKNRTTVGDYLVKPGSLRAVVVWEQAHYQAMYGGRAEARRERDKERKERTQQLKEELLGKDNTVSIRAALGKLMKAKMIKRAIQLDKATDKVIESIDFDS